MNFAEILAIVWVGGFFSCLIAGVGRLGWEAAAVDSNESYWQKESRDRRAREFFVASLCCGILMPFVLAIGAFLLLFGGPAYGARCVYNHVNRRKASNV